MREGEFRFVASDWIQVIDSGKLGLAGEALYIRMLAYQSHFASRLPIDDPEAMCGLLGVDRSTWADLAPKILHAFPDGVNPHVLSETMLAKRQRARAAHACKVRMERTTNRKNVVPAYVGNHYGSMSNDGDTCIAHADQQLVDVRGAISPPSNNSLLSRDLDIEQEIVLEGGSGGKLNDVFDRLKAAYPKRSGHQNYPLAKEKLKVRLAAGASPDAIVAAAERYRVYCRQNGLERTPHVAMLSTWISQRRYEDEIAETLLEPGGSDLNSIRAKLGG